SRIGKRVSCVAEHERCPLRMVGSPVAVSHTEKPQQGKRQKGEGKRRNFARFAVVLSLFSLEQAYPHKERLTWLSIRAFSPIPARKFSLATNCSSKAPLRSREACTC